MKWIVFPFFCLRLALSLLPFLGQVAWLILAPHSTVLIIGIVTFIHLAFVARYLVKTLVFSNPTPPSLIAFNNDQLDKIHVKILTTPEYRTFFTDDPQLADVQKKLEQYAVESPTHRDILINIALVSAVKGNVFRAEKLLENAKYSDPNSLFFH